MFNRNPMFMPFGNSLSSPIKSAINWGSILNNTQKTLGIINQAIPVYHQVKPMWNNARTMFRVMGEMCKINNINTGTNNNTTNNSAPTKEKSNEPNFFI